MESSHLSVGIPLNKSKHTLLLSILHSFIHSQSTYLSDLFQMKPTRCTLLLSIFISTSLHVSGNYMPIIRTAYRIYGTLVFFILYGWLSGLLVGMRPYIYATLVFFTLYAWLSGLLVGICMGGCLVCWLGWDHIYMRHWYFSLCKHGCLVCWLGWDRIYVTLVFFTLYAWLSGLLIPTSRPDSHPYTVKYTSVA